MTKGAHKAENCGTHAAGNQLARQWHLLQLLGHPTGLPIDEAAQQLGCAARTIWRDLRVLQDAGFPVYDERDGRRGLWRVERSFQDRLPIVSRDLLDPDGARPFGPAVASVFAKIRALLTPRALELIDRMRATVGVRPPGLTPLPAAAHLPEIQSALAERRALQIRYYSMSREAETKRRVDPYHLTYFNGGAYLVAYCHLRQSVRIFAVERIRALEPLDVTFTIPASFKVEDYDLPGGRLELTLPVADTLEVQRWLLGFGAHAEVLASYRLEGAP